MHYAIIHCRNPKCSLKIWVPAEQFGTRGRCPVCGTLLQAPQNVPPDELVEGPPIMEKEAEYQRSHAMATSV